MPYPKKLLNPYEEVALDLHPHWWFFWKQAGLLLIGIAASIVALVAGPDGGVGNALKIIAAGVAVVGALAFGFRYLQWVTTNFVVTSDRLISRRGILSRSGVQIPLERVNNVNFNQTVWERIIGTGDLMIESAGQDGEQAFSDIKHPDRVTNLIHAQMEGNENRKYDRMADTVRRPMTTPMPPPPPSGAPAGAAPGKDDVLSQLDRLEDLRQRGVITQAEFEAQKAKLLERM